jgi:hypothetical protein
MDAVELAKQLKLHPRAVIMRGRIEPRSKNQGTLSGFMPHYATVGCPLVQWSGANALPEPSAAEIEFGFVEQGFPMPSALAASPRQSNLVQLVFGGMGQSPSLGGYRVLREAGDALKRISDEKRELLLVALPLFIPAKFGAAGGKLYFVGAFGTDGVPLYLHPEAVGKILTTDFPANQKERSVAPELAQPIPSPAAEASWYKELAVGMGAATGLKGHKLHEAVLRARAGQLVDRKVAKDQKEGLGMARTDADKFLTPAAPPSKAGRALIAAGARSKARAAGPER